MSRRMAFGRYDCAAFAGFAAYAACSLVVPVALVAVARDLGFPLDAGGMAWGGSLHAGRSVAIMSSMLACAFIAARWGLRVSLGVSLAVMGASVMAAAVAPTFAALLLAVTVAGLGEGVMEGLATPAVQKLHPQEPGRYINVTHAFWSVGVLVTVLVAGWVLSAGVSWRVVIGAAGALSIIPALLFLVRGRSRTTCLDAGEPVSWRTVVALAGGIARRPRFWLFFAAMFLAGGGEFGLTFWTASFIQLEFGGRAWAGGAGTACFAGGMILGRLGWGYLTSQHRLFALIMGSAVAAAALCVAIPWLSTLTWLFPLLFLAGIAAAPFWPSIQSYSADRIPVDTTTLFIMLSCAGIPGCGAFTWLMGAIGDAYGLRASFLLVPACFLLIGVLVGFERRLGQAGEPERVPVASSGGE